MSARPFFERSPEGARSRRRLLLVSYHFPPDTSIGARRWAKLAHYVVERGWGLDVITRLRDGASSTQLDTLPGDVRVYGVPEVTGIAEHVEHAAWRLYRTARPLQPRIDPAGSPNVDQGMVSISPAPDPRPDTYARDEVRWSLSGPRQLLRAYWVWLDLSRAGQWAARATQLAESIIEPGVHFAVITSGPPHVTHESGRALSRRYRLPFIMDMRDPWSLNERLPDRLASPLWLRAAAREERRTVQQASLIVANTEPARAALAATYPDARDRIIAVMNGSDDDPIPPSRPNGRFTIRYAGSIYDYRDPRNLFRAAARVIRELALTPADFGIDFIGRTLTPGNTIPPLHEMAAREGIASYISVGPERPHREAMDFLADASMLVTFPVWNTIAIPGKTFECVRFDAWLLALAERGSAVDLLLRGTEADVIPPDDIDGLAAVLRKRIEAHARGERPVRIARDDRFSRRHQARILLDTIARFLPAQAEGALQPRSALASRS
jgi:glycosyltransferase involved in cell wall biosynthesis